MSDVSDNTGTPRRRASDRIADPCRELVPVEGLATNADDVIDAVPLRSARPDPSFVTHLIAIAERCPQTRVLRRASPQDAMAAYRSADAKSHAEPAGGTTRQNI